MSTIEILAPAGSADALKAAVRSGAAAVYLGTETFNARQHAENFSKGALKEAVTYCHTRGVKVHLTLNTLIRQQEMTDALQVAADACALGIDALIVQDLGLARRIHQAAPSMPLHASTQLSCHTPEGVRFLKQLGFSRVVLSREMSLTEIQACAKEGCELEVFVHGALCMSVSGQCYLSAVLGGRSGNRGHCAGPCRLPFSAQNTPDLTGGYALSLKDQCLATYIPALAEAGVISLKIEGRMKRPEYVAAAVSVCRAAADGKEIPKAALDDLRAVFSRSGFTDGYYTAKRDQKMFGIRRQEDVVAAAPVLKRLANSVSKERQSVAVYMHLTAAVGQPVTLTIHDSEQHSVTVTGPMVQAALSSPTTEEKAIAQLKKTGDTPFIATATAQLDDNCMVPVSVINQLRRDALEELLTQREVLSPIPFIQTETQTVKPATHTMARIVRLQSMEQYSRQLQNETVILPISVSNDTLQQFADTHKAPFGVEIPRGLFSGRESVQTKLQQVKNAGGSFAVCGNWNAVPLALQAGLQVIGGYGMNICNSDAVTVCFEQGVSALVLSPELKFSQMAFAQQAELPCGLFAYGRLPLMLTRNCPVKAAGGNCATCKGNGSLTDRKGISFPVTCENGCAQVLNSVPTYLADKADEIPSHLFSYFHFTNESAKQVAEILDLYDAKEASPFPITRGLYNKGVL
jgi:putative protease